MTFRVTILGSSAALPTATKHHSAHALNVHEQFYLIDCGEGTQGQLMKYGINPLKINAVFITHLHGDHVFGIFGLLSTLGLMGRKVPLPIYAPAPMKEVLDNHFRYFDRELPYQVVVHEVDTSKEGIIFSNRVMDVSTIPLRHRIPCTGFLFREKMPQLNIHKHAIERYGLGIAQIAAAKRGEDILLNSGESVLNSELTYLPYTPRSYAYCSDTLASGRVAGIVWGVDLLYHEATFSGGDKKLATATGHSTASQAATIALKANVKRLVIGHNSMRYKHPGELLEEARTIFAQSYSAQEGTEFEIQIKKYE